MVAGWRWMSERELRPASIVADASESVSRPGAVSVGQPPERIEDDSSELLVGFDEGFDLELLAPDQPWTAALRQRAMQPGESNDRLEAITELGDVPGWLAGSALRSLLDDPAPSIRQEAIESLATKGGESAVIDLSYALSDQDPVVRRLAIEALAEIGTGDAVSALAWTLNETDASLRELAAEELAEIDTDQSNALLQRFLTDVDVEVRQTVAELLMSTASTDNE